MREELSIVVGAAAFLVAACAATGWAGIDSGGGLHDLGAGSNHSSIGSPFATGDLASGLIEVIYPSPASELPDTDADGLPDAWESQYFGSVGTTPLADADADGTNNLMEYLAATDPRSASSVFRPSSSLRGADLLLTIPTVVGRQYRIWGSADLKSWTQRDTFSGDGSIVEWAYAPSQSPTGRYFLKVELLITPNP
jgi:hypothetical protein